ncbi:MAG: efflux RND transporter permease subunit, partial [Pirellulaceae bacterium]|nr:efflux RND transporter permease subunit [Pirellulaceae bacterium]
KETSNRYSLGSIPLTTLGEATLMPKASVIWRNNGRRVNLVQSFITAGVLPATVQADFLERLDSSGFELPKGYSFEMGGEAEQRDGAVGNLMSSVLPLMVMMAATLVLSFGSFRLAALIAVIAVSAIGLGLGALWVFGFPFGFMAIVGTMGLIGVAINDAIVVLAALRGDPQAKIGNQSAVIRVVLKATRHVLATTFTTIFGFLPLILTGGSFWTPLATIIAGGVTGATLMALIFIPSAYLLLERNKKVVPLVDSTSANFSPESFPVPETT